MTEVADQHRPDEADIEVKLKSLYAGQRLYVDLGPEKHFERARKVVASTAPSLGFTLTDYAQADVVIATHAQQDVALAAQRDGKRQANILWLLACCYGMGQVDITKEYLPFSASPIPGFKAYAPGISFTGTEIDTERTLLKYLICVAGSEPHSSITPDSTTHLLVKDWATPSAKVEEIRRRRWKTHVVHWKWITQCLHEGRVVPEEPYYEPAYVPTQYPPTQPHPQPVLPATAADTLPVADQTVFGASSAVATAPAACTAEVHAALQRVAAETAALEAAAGQTVHELPPAPAVPQSPTVPELTPTAGPPAGPSQPHAAAAATAAAAVGASSGASASQGAGLSRLAGVGSSEAAEQGWHAAGQLLDQLGVGLESSDLDTVGAAGAAMYTHLQRHAGKAQPAAHDQVMEAVQEQAQEQAQEDVAVTMAVLGPEVGAVEHNGEEEEAEDATEQPEELDEAVQEEGWVAAAGAEYQAPVEGGAGDVGPVGDLELIPASPAASEPLDVVEDAVGHEVLAMWASQGDEALDEGLQGHEEGADEGRDGMPDDVEMVAASDTHMPLVGAEEEQGGAGAGEVEQGAEVAEAVGRVAQPLPAASPDVQGAAAASASPGITAAPAAVQVAAVAAAEAEEAGAAPVLPAVAAIKRRKAGAGGVSVPKLLPAAQVASGTDVPDQGQQEGQAEQVQGLGVARLQGDGEVRVSVSPVPVKPLRGKAAPGGARGKGGARSKPAVASPASPASHVSQSQSVDRQLAGTNGVGLEGDEEAAPSRPAYKAPPGKTGAVAAATSNGKALKDTAASSHGKKGGRKTKGQQDKAGAGPEAGTETGTGEELPADPPMQQAAKQAKRRRSSGRVAAAAGVHAEEQLEEAEVVAEVPKAIRKEKKSKGASTGSAKEVKRAGEEKSVGKKGKSKGGKPSETEAEDGRAAIAAAGAAAPPAKRARRSSIAVPATAATPVSGAKAKGSHSARGTADQGGGKRRSSVAAALVDAAEGQDVEMGVGGEVEAQVQPGKASRAAGGKSNGKKAKQSSKASKQAEKEEQEDDKEEEARAAAPKAKGKKGKQAAGAKGVLSGGKIAKAAAAEEPEAEEVEAVVAHKKVKRATSSKHAQGKGKATPSGKAGQSGQAAAAKPLQQQAGSKRRRSGKGATDDEEEEQVEEQAAPSSRGKAKGHKSKRQRSSVGGEGAGGGSGATEDWALSPATRAAAAQLARAVFALSGLNTEEKQRVAAGLKKLKVASSSIKTGASWEVGVTHVLAPSLKRSDKTVCAMAAGNWLLDSTKYLKACSEAGQLLPPAPYELSEPAEATMNQNPTIEPAAPNMWRVRREVTGKGAFAGVRTVIVGSPATPLTPEALSLMILAGGGSVTHLKGVSAASQLSALLAAPEHPSFAIVDTNKTASDKLVQQLLDSGVTCVSPAYVVEWVAFPSKEVMSHHLYLYGSKPTVDLQLLEENRSCAIKVVAAVSESL